MMEIHINDLIIDDVSNFRQQVLDSENGGRRLIQFDFKVHSDDYHRITTELYKNEFLVRVPEYNLEFNAVIQNYYTSITDLYVEDAIGEFSLALVEK